MTMLVSTLYEHPVFIALAWMLLANLFAVGPDRLKVAALVLMLITAGPILVAVRQTSGWLVAFPLMILMFIQMRWAIYFIARLWKHYFGPVEDG